MVAPDTSRDADAPSSPCAGEVAGQPEEEGVVDQQASIGVSSNDSYSPRSSPGSPSNYEGDSPPVEVVVEAATSAVTPTTPRQVDAERGVAVVR